MLTLNVIQDGDNKVITGTVNGEKFNLNYTEAIYASLLVHKEEFESIEIMDDYEKWVETVKKVLDTDTEDITTACPDLMRSPKGTYHIQVDSIVSKKSVPQPIVDVILESIEKGISPTPIIKAWIRFLRNPNFSPSKADNFAAYITAEIIDREELDRLMEEEGYIYSKAELRATYNDVAISQEGLVVGKKYARLLTEGWEIDPETNKAVKTKLGYIEPDTIDGHTGVITEGGVAKSTFNEDLIFEPPMMGTSGNAFLCGQQEGHIIKVGQKHTLEKWSMVNTNDNTSCVPGLHIGGWQYVQSYKSINAQLLECFVDPAEIGAICDIGYGDGAMRVREYFIYGATEGRNKGIYHSSHYAKQKDADWEKYKKEAIKKSNELMEGLQSEVDELGA